MSQDTIDIPAGYTPLMPERKQDYMGLIGPFYVRPLDHGLCIGIRLEFRHCNPFKEAHGGFMTAMADLSLGACLLHSEARPPSVATLSLTSNFLAPPRLGDWVEAHARPDRVGLRIAFASVDFMVAGERVGYASGTFKVFTAEAMQRRRERGREGRAPTAS